jgi:hypothetical protein
MKEHRIGDPAPDATPFRREGTRGENMVPKHNDRPSTQESTRDQRSRPASQGEANDPMRSAGLEVFLRPLDAAGERTASLAGDNQ